jgi:hypothetical protein
MVNLLNIKLYNNWIYNEEIFTDYLSVYLTWWNIIIISLVNILNTVYMEIYK